MKCYNCRNRGKSPICIACGRTLVRRDFEQERRQEIIDYRDAEDEKLLRLMHKNMQKTNSTTTGSPTLDAQIKKVVGE